MSDQGRELNVLGRTIRELREGRDLSAGDLAAAAGIEGKRLGEIEAGEFDPTYDVLLALAAGLGVEAGAFVRRAEELRGPSRLLRPGERLLTSGEFEHDFGQLPTDGEG